MNVPWNLMPVIQMQLVTIPMEATCVYVTLNSLEMGYIAWVLIMNGNMFRNSYLTSLFSQILMSVNKSH